MIKKFSLLMLAITTVATIDRAAQAADQNTASLTTNSSVSTWYSEPVLIGGWRSYNDMGRGREMADPSGRRLKSKNEYYLGAKSKAGWGALLQGVEVSNTYGLASKNTFSPADGNFSFIHPVFDTGTVKMTGMLREYFPVSDRSVTYNIWQQAYYSFLTVKMKHQWDLNNVLIPRYFSQARYQPNDATFYTEDFTTLSRPVAKWCKIGVGQHAQVEAHSAIPTGTTVDIYPYADLMLSPTIFASPRIYMPVLVNGAVTDSATSVSASNIQAELYLQATL